MVTCYVLCGISGSGKTTMSYILAKEYNAQLYCFDDMRKGYRFEERQKVHDKIYACIREDFSNGFNVVYDNLNITYERRIELLLAIKDIPCKKILIVMTTPLEVCIHRNAERKNRLHDSVIYHLNTRYCPPSLDEGWDDIWYY